MFRVLLTCAALGLAASAWAVPVQLTHQGRALDAGGAPLNGPGTVQISLYDTGASGPASVWDESLPVTFEQGYYSVVLGKSPTNLLDSGLLSTDEVWLGIGVNGNPELDPRAELTHVPLAAVAASVRGDVVLANTTPCSSANNGALTYDGTNVQVCDGTDYVAIGGGVASTGGVATGGDSVHTWEDGSVAASCFDYRYPTGGNSYSGSTGSGLYRIDPDSGGSFDVYCDMVTDGGGWTLVLRASQFDAGVDFNTEAAGWSSTGYRTIQDVNLASSTSTNDHVSAAYARLASDDVMVRQNLPPNDTNSVWSKDAPLQGQTLHSLLDLSAVDGGRACSRSVVFGAGTPTLATYDSLVFAGDETGDTEPTMIGVRNACSQDNELMAMGSQGSGHGTAEVTSQSGQWSGFSSAMVFVRSHAPTGDIVARGGSRWWADNTYAASCKEYRTPVGGHAYDGDIGNGVYRIDPLGSGPFDVYCDMSTNGGGWTLVLRVSQHDAGVNFNTNAAGWSLSQYRSVQDLAFSQGNNRDHVSPAYGTVTASDVMVRERTEPDRVHMVRSVDGFLGGATLRSILSQPWIDGGRACSSGVVFGAGTPTTSGYTFLVLSGDETGDTEPTMIGTRVACNGDNEMLALGSQGSGHGTSEATSQGGTWGALTSSMVFVR